MTGGLVDAPTLERWNVINRVLPDAELRGQVARIRPPSGGRAYPS